MKLIEFKMPEELFHKQFKTLLVFTNFYKTIITAYTIKREQSIYILNTIKKND